MFVMFVAHARSNVGKSLPTVGQQRVDPMKNTRQLAAANPWKILAN
jgi:hypothetical protein